MPTSSLLRKRGRDVLRGHWQTALLITFAADILITLIYMLNAKIRLDLDVMVKNRYFFSYSNEMYALRIYLDSAIVLAVLAILVGPVLAIGLNHYYLELHLGRETKFSMLFSRMHIFGKCLGQAIVIELIVLFWSLIILVPCFLLNLTVLYSRFWFVVTALAAGVSGTVAWCRYAMAPFLLAEDPVLGVMDSIRKSKEIMAGNKGKLYCLCLSFIGWALLVSAMTYFLSCLAGLTGYAIGLFLGLALHVYIYSAVTAFYLELPTSYNRPEKQEQEDDY